MAPIGCVQEPYELKACPTDITDLDWPKSKELTQDQEMWDWASEINSAEWTLCHVQIAHKIPVVICDHLIKGMLHVMSNFVKASCTGMYGFCNYRRRAMFTLCDGIDQAKVPL